MKNLISFSIVACLLIVFNTELMAQGPYYTSFPDIDGDGFKEPLTAGTTYDINDFTFTFPGNVNIRNTGDSITFLAVFLATGCQSNCADLSLPFYHSSGQMFGVMGADRRYHGSVSFPMPGEYLLVGITKNGFGVRETFRVTNCGGGLADPFISAIPVVNNTQPLYYTSFPDIDGDGFKEPLTAGTTYDINDFTFNFPGNVNIRNTGDSITFLAVFLATGCQSNCADLSLPFYHSSGQMFGVMGADRRYHGRVSFPMPGEYLLVGITKNGFGVRETFEVTKCPPQDTVFLTNTVYITNPDTLVIQFSFSGGTTGTNLIENNEIKVYPNPVNNLLKVTGLPNGVSAIVYNLSGQVVMNPLSPSEINVTSLPAGSYILRFSQQETAVGAVQFIKQ